MTDDKTFAKVFMYFLQYNGALLLCGAKSTHNLKLGKFAKCHGSAGLWQQAANGSEAAEQAHEVKWG